MKKGSLLIGNISQLLLCHADQGKALRGKQQGLLDVLYDAALLIVDGRIAEYGDHQHFIKKYDDVPMFDAMNSLMMPGFVDPHTHLVFAGSREEEFLARIRGEDYLSNLGKGKGILHTVEMTRKAKPEELYQTARKTLMDMLLLGTTSMESKSGYGLDLRTELLSLQINRRLQNDLKVLIPSTLLAAHAIPLEFLGQPDEYLEYIAEHIIPNVVHEKLADFIDVFCEKNVFNAKQSAWILNKGIAAGLKAKLHTDEFYSIGGIDVALSVNAHSADHLMQINPHDLKKLSKSKTIGVVLPGTAFNMTTDNTLYPRKLIDAHVPVALGTDYNPGTCMCNSMQIMMELSILKMGLTVEEAINASTINAAFACGIQEHTGSIEHGKRANLLLMKVDRYQKLPYLWGTNKVKSVFLNGQLLDFQND